MLVTFTDTVTQAKFLVELPQPDLTHEHWYASISPQIKRVRQEVYDQLGYKGVLSDTAMTITTQLGNTWTWKPNQVPVNSQ